MKKEREIIETVQLCDAAGELNRDAVGWSRVPLQVCNLKGRWPRKKKWNYWCVTSDEYAFSATVADIDYIGLGAVYFIDCGRRRLVEKTVPTPLGSGIKQVETVEADATFAARDMKIELLHSPGRMSMKVRSSGLTEGDLEADITVEKPDGHETLNVVVPWNNRTFQFTSKQNTLPASGSVTIGGREYKFNRDNAYACLDFGRGIWPYSTKWNWGSCSGRSGKDVVGLNLGGKWTDGTGSTENGICLNGRLYKVSEDLIWEYDRNDFMAPWKVRTPDSDDIDLTLEPFYDKYTKANFAVLGTVCHQMFGKYYGTVRADGREVKLDGIMGWAEESISKW